MKNPAALMALFESLCSVEYHRSNMHLAKHFNFVFNEIQNKKVLRIRDTLPAMAKFLFDSDPQRNRFATNAWERMEATLTPSVFEWVVHDALSEAIFQVSQPGANPKEVAAFWRGFVLVLARMDEDLITHSLKAMEIQPNIYQVGIRP